MTKYILEATEDDTGNTIEWEIVMYDDETDEIERFTQFERYKGED